MGSRGRKTGLFVVSYAPLAAMFLAIEWPEGWKAAELGALAIWLAGCTGLLVLPLASAFTPSGTGRRVSAVGSVVSVTVVALGISFSWYEPLAVDTAKGTTSALAAGIAYVFLLAGLLLTALLLTSARRVSRLRWRISDPRDQGSAVAAYLPTYLLPLLDPAGHGVRTSIAYGVYLLTLYVIFVRSERLVLVNPTLYFFSFRIFDVRIDPPDETLSRRVLLLAREPIPDSADADVVPLGEDCYIATAVGSGSQ